MRIHLIDGTFELYRAHFSPRPRVLRGEEDITATVGVVGSLAALIRDPDEGVTHVGVAFDNPITSFRNGLFDGYKTDEGVPPELRRQFDLVEDACRAAGFVVWSMKDFEADDALATAARRFASDDFEVCICSPDKDLGQALSGTKITQLDRIRKKRTTEASFKETRGFGPESMPDYLALVGDTADGIPGLKGFGEKTTAGLLGRFPHLEDVLTSVDAWSNDLRGGARLRETLLAGKDDALLYRTLATLRYDVPLAESASDLRYVGPTDAAFLEALGAGKIAARLVPGVPLAAP
jgi:5'-3' exonuclease